MIVEKVKASLYGPTEIYIKEIGSKTERMVLEFTN